MRCLVFSRLELGKLRFRSAKLYLLKTTQNWSELKSDPEASVRGFFFKTVLRLTQWWKLLIKLHRRSSLVALWLGFWAFTAMAQVQSQGSGNWDPASHVVRPKQNKTKLHRDIHMPGEAHQWECQNPTHLLLFSFSHLSFFLLCSLRKRIRLLCLIIIMHRVEFWPTMGGCLGLRLRLCLISWAWWYVWLLWETDPESWTWAQVFMWKVQEVQKWPKKGAVRY